MKYNTTRIPLDSLKIKDLSSPADNGGADSSPGLIPAGFPSLDVSFALSGETLPEYGSTLPYGVIEFDISKEDTSRVEAWFTGDYDNVTLPPSATLKKNMTAAVRGFLSNYYSRLRSRNLLGAPFRIGWRYRLFDGSTKRVQEPVLLMPARKAPVIEITDYWIDYASLHTSVVLHTLPAKVSFNIGIPSLPPELAGAVKAIEIFMTKPVTLYSNLCTVSGIRSVMLDDSRIRSWHY